MDRKREERAHRVLLQTIRARMDDQKEPAQCAQAMGAPIQTVWSIRKGDFRDKKVFKGLLALLLINEEVSLKNHLKVVFAKIQRQEVGWKQRLAFAKKKRAQLKLDCRRGRGSCHQ